MSLPHAERLAGALRWGPACHSSSGPAPKVRSTLLQGGRAEERPNYWGFWGPCRVAQGGYGEHDKVVAYCIRAIAYINTESLLLLLGVLIDQWLHALTRSRKVAGSTPIWPCHWTFQEENSANFLNSIAGVYY